MTILVRPELPAGAAPLSALERRAVALAALGHRNVAITKTLYEEKYDVAAGVGKVWSSAAKKLGTVRARSQQPELVFRARVHGVLDLPDPVESSRLPPDVLHYIQALARGRTQKEYALEDVGLPVWEVDDIAQHARKLLGGAPTQASTVYRALPQLLRTVQPPIEDVATDLLPAVQSTAVVTEVQTELPGNAAALRAGRTWIRCCLPALGWAGPVLHAEEVLTRLVDNGVRHGLPDSTEMQTLLVRAAVDEAGSLFIDVSDLNPSFPDFDAAARGERGLGLRNVARLGARITRFLHHDSPGKTVRAVLAPAPVDP
ncbi:ATP-binding protein [Streptomyces bottropensis]|uniref:ATP-binding protein n=1 Tax=Streptomyces bottropensis TaxID=42235 RepID=UPI00368A537E